MEVPLIDWPETITQEWVEEMLGQASIVDACLPDTGPRLGAGLLSLELRAAAAEAAEAWRLDRPVPSAGEITDAEEVARWPMLISNPVVRRIVQARTQIRPLSERHVYTWPQIAAQVGASRQAAQLWYGQGLAEIARSLTAQRLRPAA